MYSKVQFSIAINYIICFHYQLVMVQSWSIDKEINNTPTTNLTALLCAYKGQDLFKVRTVKLHFKVSTQC